jgi:trigger factor
VPFQARSTQEGHPTLALIEGCKHSLEITIPADAMAAEIERVTEKVRQKARLKGFRPGKAPVSQIKSVFGAEIRQEALENLIPKVLEAACEKENLRPVSRPDIKDLHFHDGESVHFKAEFEVSPEIELKELRGLTVEYAAPEVTDADIEKRLEELRDSRAQFVNVDPREVQDGDHCMVDLASLSGLDGEPMKQEGINIEVGGKDTFAAFTEALRGAIPGDEREAEVTYPEDYGVAKLAGRSVRFRITLKAIRLKELPELNDEFAKDLGDFQSLDEVREEIRKGIHRDREYLAQTEAKNKLVDQMVALHEFPVPESYIEQQVETIVENQLRNLQQQGIDASKIKLDWNMLRQSQRDRAIHDVRASMLLGKLSTAENISVTQDELDAEVQRIARQRREPVAAVRMNLEKDGSLNRIINRIITEKTLNWLFENATKVAPAPKPEAAAE